ncbi:alpha/beta fold hydrolase [Actinophytocola oryzae]|uniref:Pimeloyl-ACP methyl ester carboxylesterase n=1 Tax=Actinophytocola oryzae TaxID=502181 RepID=A0A4R7VAY8_9PSEU|nr:alpha/beta hydrolase [Actinophytocola oryzae]TDV46174.1 pimeloyl-ACP methyl ester carboxylesterase [Actinophytocola oryzae]
MIELGHRTTGEPDGGPPVVLLHALGSSARTWADLAKRLPRHSVALDLRGHGTSPHTDDYTFTAMADDVLHFMDRHGHDTVDLVGHSLGGAVAMHVAMKAPDRVRLMVVEDIAPPPHERTEPIEVPAAPPEPVDFDWAVVHTVKHLVRTPDPTWWAGLPRIPADTLWLAGGQGSHVDQGRLREAAQLMPTATVVEIPVGHRIHSEAPDDFAAVVVPFLSRAAS